MNNEHGVTMKQTENYYVDLILESGFAKTKKEAKDMLIEALFRNIVINEVMDMCEYLHEKEENKCLGSK